MRNTPTAIFFYYYVITLFRMRAIWGQLSCSTLTRPVILIRYNRDAAKKVLLHALCGLRSAYSATGSAYERISARAAAISSSDGRRAGRAQGISSAAYLEPA